MPSLKQLSCYLQWAETGVPFPEYGTVYGDGVVETYIVVPKKPQAFTIRLLSTAFIYEGLAALVFVDGNYQANRNRTNLKPCTNGQQADEKTNIDLLMRQKEKSLGDGLYIGREWRFDDHNIVPQTSVTSNNSHFDDLGTIEVIILRCHSRLEEARSPSIVSSAADSDVFGDHSPAVSGEASNLVNTDSKAKDSVESEDLDTVSGLAGLFDGTSERNESHQERNTQGHTQGAWQPFDTLRNPAQHPQSDPSTQQQPKRHVHFDFGPSGPPPHLQGPTDGPVGFRPRSHDRNRESTWSPSSSSVNSQETIRNQSAHIPQPESFQPVYHPYGSVPYTSPVHPTAGWSWYPNNQSIPYVPHYPAPYTQFGPNLQWPYHGSYMDPSYRYPQAEQNVGTEPTPKNGGQNYNSDQQQIYGAVDGTNQNWFPQQEMNGAVPGTNHSGSTWNDVHPTQTAGDLTANPAPAEDPSLKDGWQTNSNTGIKWDDQGNTQADWSFQSSGNQDGGQNDDHIDRSHQDSTNQWNSGNNEDWTHQNTCDNQNVQNMTFNGAATEQTGNQTGRDSWNTQDISSEQKHMQGTLSITQERPLFGPHGRYYSTKAPDPTEPTADVEEEPRYDVPEAVALKLGTTKQVQPGPGYLYWKKRSTPEYIDTVHEPYARFVFKYRTRDQLKLLVGIGPDTEPTGNEAAQEFEAMGKSDLIGLLLQAKNALGGKLPGPSALSASSTNAATAGPCFIEPPVQGFLNSQIPPTRQSAGSALQSVVEKNPAAHPVPSNSWDAGAHTDNSQACTMKTGYTPPGVPYSWAFSTVTPAVDKLQQQPAQTCRTTSFGPSANNPDDPSIYFPLPVSGPALGKEKINQARSPTSSPASDTAATFSIPNPASVGTPIEEPKPKHGW